MKPAHVRVVFSGLVGTVAAPVEHWAFGVNFPHDAISPANDDVVDDALAGTLKGVWDGALKPYTPGDNFLTSVKVSRVGDDGHVEKRPDGSYLQGEWVGSSVGAAGTITMPLSTALVVSLTTARSGPTGKGRIFLPFPGMVLQVADKRLSAADATTMAGAAKQFINNLATVMTFPAQVVSSKGYMSAVTGVRVGRVPDTLRSRRRSSPEAYVSLPLA